MRGSSTARRLPPSSPLTELLGWLSPGVTKLEHSPGLCVSFQESSKNQEADISDCELIDLGFPPLSNPCILA